MNLDRQVQYLAQARKEAAEVKEEIEVAQAALESTKEWADLTTAKARLAAYTQAQAEAEDHVRYVALMEWEANGNKHPHPAITIKNMAVVDYDRHIAKLYCMDFHISNALKLDERAFEKSAKVLELDFVTISEHPKATIATDLTAYLGLS